MAHCLHGWCPSSHKDVNQHAGATKSKGSSAKGRPPAAAHGVKAAVHTPAVAPTASAKGAKKEATPSVLSLPGGSKQAPAGKMSSPCLASICYGTRQRGCDKYVKSHKRGLELIPNHHAPDVVPFASVWR